MLISSILPGTSSIVGTSDSWCVLSHPQPSHSKCLWT